MNSSEGPPSEGLPSSGPERAIFLRALQQFSDECEPPELQPLCPFSVELADGGRGCAEECMDILAEHGGPRSLREGVDLGNGIVAERRPVRQFRPRRGPEAGSRPFDARATMVRDRDSGRPVATWSTISLMKVLEDELSHSPVDANPERNARIASCWQELERRGHDVQGYVRWGIGRFVATSVAIATVLPDLEDADEDEETDNPPVRLREAPAGWESLLAQVHEPDPSLDMAFASMPPEERVKAVRVMGALVGPFAELARAWVKIATQDDLIAWRPPSDPSEVLTLAAIEAVTKEERETYRWLVDRFTKTYLNDWAKESLYLEWRYLHAELVAPCSSVEMRQRRIADVDVSKAIASRVAPVHKDRRDVDSDEAEPAEAPALSIDQLVNAAAEFLEAGRRIAASALFEAAKRDNPDNAEVRNNYGFCLLPDNPQRGLQEIYAAEELGFTPRCVNLANRMYGLFRLQRFASALEVAERLFGEEDHEAWLWDWRKDPENTTILCVNARTYGIQFALDIAQATGDIAQANLRAGRAEKLGLDSEA
jgi:hypothetical protein